MNITKNLGRLTTSFLTAITLLALTAAVALAAVTWHSGPTVTFYGSTSVKATGDGSGFGNQPAVATLRVNALVQYTCQNKGGTQVPGRNPVAASSSGSQSLGNADHNGRGIFNLTVSFIPAETVPGKSIGCPNGNWTGVNPVSLGITSARLTITQGTKTIFGPRTYYN